MSGRRGKYNIARPDRRIGATLETLAFLFDVSVPAVLRAAKAGNIKPSTNVFGVKLYHVSSVEKALFGLAPEGQLDAEQRGPGADPFLEALEKPDAAPAKKERRRRDAAA